MAKRLCHDFERRMLYYDVRRLLPEAKSAHGMTFVSVEELLRQSDIVSLHLALLPETRGFIGAIALARMKPKAVSVNISGGRTC